MLEREHLLVKDFPVQFLAARIDRESRPQSQANVSFEEKIRKIGELIALSRRVKAGRVSEDSHSTRDPVSKIRNRLPGNQANTRVDLSHANPQLRMAFNTGPRAFPFAVRR